jgi:hypothetical protein
MCNQNKTKINEKKNSCINKNTILAVLNCKTKK